MKIFPLTIELLKKELRLQRNNAMFALAVVLLGLIGLLTVKQAGPDIMSFSADDIRDSLFMLVLCPALVVILPLMVGSTAAASERALGVWAWQSAMPISWRRVIFFKTVVVAIFCAILAGVLPYLLQFFSPPKEHSLLHLFRDTWPGWFGILCGAIGFYSGALARDDYHGLLISVLPLGLILLIMWLADPFLLVSPVFWVGPIWEEWALASRLLLLALLLVVFAGRLSRRHGQPRGWQVAKQTAVFLPLVFVLTLWNITTERPPILNRENVFQPGTTPTRYSDLHLLPSYPIARAFSQEEAESRGYYSTTIHIDEKAPAGSRFIIGTAGREYIRSDDLRSGRGTIFLIGRDRQISEFPHADGSLYGHTGNGRWIWINHHSAAEAICGPYGLTISKMLLPDSWFDALRKTISFMPAGQGYNEFGKERWELQKIATDKDQFVHLNKNYILWKNAKLAVPQNLTPQYREITSLGTFRTLAVGIVGYPMDSGNVVVLFADDTGSTVSALLKPQNDEAEYELHGWLPGEITGLSDDLQWGSSRLSPRGTGAPEELVFGPAMASPRPVDESDDHWVVPMTEQTRENGSTVTKLHWFRGQLPVVAQDGQNYTWFSYRKSAPVSFNNQQTANDFPVEHGLVILNLETGEETYVPTPVPWPAEGTLKLQGSTAAQWPQHTFTWPDYKWHSASGRFAAILVHYIGFSRLSNANWKDGEMQFYYAMIPHMDQGAFLSEREFIATDGATIWGIYVP